MQKLRLREIKSVKMYVPFKSISVNILFVFGAFGVTIYPVILINTGRMFFRQFLGSYS